MERTRDRMRQRDTERHTERVCVCFVVGLSELFGI